MADLNRSKTAVLFFHRAVTYLVLLMVVILMEIPLLTQTHRSIRENALNIFLTDINQGVAALEEKANAFVKIGSLVKGESCYKKLLFVTGAPEPTDYMEMNNLQTRLSTLCLSHEYIKDMYILFRDSDMYVSNHIVSDDYKSVYPTFLRQSQVSAQTWRESILSFPAPFEMQYTPGVTSSYSRPQEYDALTFIANLTPNRVFTKRGVLVCHMDFGVVIGGILRSDLLDTGFLYIADMSGSVVAAHNPRAAALSDEFRPDAPVPGYTVIASNPSAFGYRIYLGIPNDYFNNVIKSSFNIFKMYIFIGTSLVLLLSIVLTLRETRRLKRIVHTASSLFPSVSTSKFHVDEFAYIDKILSASATELQKLNQTLKTHVLANLFFSQLPPDKMPAADDLFENAFERYIVAVVQLRGHGADESLGQALFVLEGLCRSMIGIPFVPTYTGFRELSLLISVKGLENGQAEVSGAFSRLTERLQMHPEAQALIVHVGVSLPASGPDNARAAYLQARDTVSMRANTSASGVYAYSAGNSPVRPKLIDVSMLAKCYDCIICGDSEGLSAFFTQICEAILKSDYDYQDKTQLLYSIRHPIYNAYLAVCAANEACEQEMPFPALNHQQPFQWNIELLEAFSLKACSRMRDRKQLRQLRLKDEILDFIRQGFTDLSFTPFTAANAFQTSENYVQSIIKEATGKSFRLFIEDLRVDKAEALLRDTAETNAKIALACGFGSENTFYRAFARRHGVSPSKWAGRAADE